MSDHFVVGHKYETVNLTEILIDPNNQNEPHPVFYDKDRGGEGTLHPSDRFLVKEILEVIENDLWPLVTPNQESVYNEEGTGYVMKVKLDRMEEEAILYLYSGMCDRKEVFEVIS